MAQLAGTAKLRLNCFTQVRSPSSFYTSSNSPCQPHNTDFRTTMSSIGPSLPPHLVKRKREEEDEPASAKPTRDLSSSPEAGEKRRRVLGPARPPSSETTSPPRVLGPTLPPASLSERPTSPPSDDDTNSDDDDFGPAPPPANAPTHADNDGAAQSAFDTDPKYEEKPQKPQRDEWMMLPPSADDLASRVDPTKLRARKFNTGKGARAPGAADMAIWTETPEQKRKRLENEVLGKTTPANSSRAPAPRDREAEAIARRIREHTDQVRGKSLVEKHKEKGIGKDEEDDPSKRAFDYEKDMGGGMKIGNKERRELVNKAKGFSDRFSGGGFL